MRERFTIQGQQVHDTKKPREMLDVVDRNHQTLEGESQVRQEMSILEEVVTAGEGILCDDICGETAKGVVQNHGLICSRIAPDAQTELLREPCDDKLKLGHGTFGKERSNRSTPDAVQLVGRGGQGSLASTCQSVHGHQTGHGVQTLGNLQSESALR